MRGRKTKRQSPFFEWGCRSGAALIASLGLLAILAIVGFVFYEAMQVETQWSKMDMARMRAYYCAVGGIEAALKGLGDDAAALLNGTWPMLQYSFEDNAGSYKVEVQRQPLPNNRFGYQVTSTGQSNFDGMIGRRRIRVTVEPQPGSPGRVRIISWEEP